ncbi:MAG: hypothetical protein IKJ88_05475 [Clostridia bacterium]|nr:hypothetical protein [Clostridia bacterium]
MNEKIFAFDIQMFAEGTAEGGGTENTSQSGLTGDFSADFTKYVLGKESAPVSQKENAKADDDTSGTEEQESEEAETEESSEVAEDNSADPEKEFEELIKGKFKGAFQKRTQGIINERFKNAKETEGKLKTAMDALAPLFDRYGIEEGDIDGLKNAVKGDAGIFAKKALEKGMESEAYRDAFNAERDRSQQAAERNQQLRIEAAREKYRDWKAQEAEIQKTYPSFDLTKAFTENENFKKMAELGVPLMQAYRAGYFDEIATGLVAAATKRAAKQTVDSMQGNARRPKEGGLNSAGATVNKKDVNSLNDNDIHEILKEVAKGAKITF